MKIDITADGTVRGRIDNPKHALDFAFNGNATFTIVSLLSTKSFTYKITRKKAEKDEKPEDLYFVKLLTGPNNEEDYTLFGLYRAGHLHLTKKSGYTLTTPSVVALNAVLNTLKTLAAAGIEVMPKTLEFWHEGHCCRCGRKLTVKDSIERGLGSVCAGKVGL